MRRVILAVVGTALGLVLLLGFKTAPASSRPALQGLPSSPGTGGSTAGPTPAASAPSTGSGGSNGGSGSGGGTSSAARTVQGQAVDTPYGPVQVQITVAGTKITEVKALQLPNDRGRSAMISQYSAPILRQEALRAQSANIDIVSGATFTSQGYAQSLQSALDAAHA